MDTTNYGFNNMGSSQPAKTDEKEQTQVPMVVQQLKEYKGDISQGVTMWGYKVNIVKLVGYVVNIENSSTKITYSIQDHTGSIDCYLWLEEDTTKELSNIMINTYVEVFGNVRKVQDNVLIMVFKIRPLTTFNQVTTHLLEVVHTRYKYEEMRKEDDNSSMGTHTSGPTNTFEANNMSAFGSGSLNKQQQALYDAIRSFPYPEGISTKQLLEKFPNVSPSEMSKITDFLCNEGHIYTSIDSDHFLSTDI
uniref:Putative single-stranded dna-binding replication protein a rpa medium 30 kd subunit n=1 Tax=Xenopsylla cheopis TaxID=163159 RepID=A0A6M2DRX8_XENCH